MLRLLLNHKKIYPDLTAICTLNSVISACSLIGLFYFLSLTKNPSSYDELIYFSHSLLGVHLSLPSFKMHPCCLRSGKGLNSRVFSCFLLEASNPQRAPDTLVLFSNFLRMSRTSLTQLRRCCQCLTKHLGKVTDKSNRRQ